MNNRLECRTSFSAAHRLADYDGPCQRLHGHNWDVTVSIMAEEFKGDMLLDFNKVKEVVKKLDHQYLGFGDLKDADGKAIRAVLDFNPTAENISKWLYWAIVDNCDLPKPNNLSIRVYESEKCFFEFRG